MPFLFPLGWKLYWLQPRTTCHLEADGRVHRVSLTWEWAPIGT